MADVFDKETNTLLKSVNTPDYLTERYIINPSFVPICDPKYITVEMDGDTATIREMTPEEKAVVDYVEPSPDPTAEELASQRNYDIASEIAKTYSLTDEVQIIRNALVQAVPDSIDVSTWDLVVLAAKAKYPKQ